MLLVLTETNEGVGPRLLHKLKFNEIEVTKKIMELLPPIEKDAFNGIVRFTKEYKVMLALAAREALARKDYFIGTHHVLFAFIRRQKAPGELLAAAGINAESVGSELLSMVREGIAKD
jgi:ATP-dependent Clp protease ATP-binding subunit ClpA